MGASIEEKDQSSQFDATIKLDYLTVPLMVKYYVAPGFSLDGGPVVSYLLSAKTDFDESGDGFSQSGEANVIDFYNRLDFGIGFGATYRLNSGLGFSARYILGLSNISDDPIFTGVLGVEDDSVNNNVIQVSLLYFFN